MGSVSVSDVKWQRCQHVLIPLARTERERVKQVQEIHYGQRDREKS